MLPNEFKDFRNFLYVVWKALGLPDPTPVQYEIARFIQYGPDPSRPPWEAPNNRIFLGGFRGVGKSWILATFFDWLLAWDPSLNLMAVSGSKDRSDDFTTFCQRLILEIDLLRFLEPARKDRWSKISFDVEGATASHSPSLKSRSITGMLVGTRADVIGADDIETPQNYETQAQREKIERYSAEFDLILKPGGRIIYLGTFQGADSMYGRLPARGYTAWLIPSRFPRVDEIPQYRGMLAPFIEEQVTLCPEIAGQPTDPKRFDEITLQEKEASMGHSIAMLQLMLNPTMTDRERYPLRTSDLVVMDLDTDVGPEKVLWAADDRYSVDLPNPGFLGDSWYGPMALPGQFRPYTGAVMHIDPAGSGKDETAVCITKMLNSQIFLLEMWATLETGANTGPLIQIAALAAKHNVSQIIIEDNFGDGMYGRLLAPVLRKIYQTSEGTGCAIESIKHSSNKEKRMIAALEPVMNQHKLIVNTKVIEWDHITGDTHYHLIHQMTRLMDMQGCLPHDDRIDVLAMAAQYWNEAMGLDPDEMMERARQADLEAEFAKFLEPIGASGLSETTWISTNRHRREARW